MDNEGKVHGGSVEAVVQETLGDVQSADVAPLLTVGGKYYLVHTATVIGQVISVLQSFHNVIGVQHCVGADGPEPGCAQGADVGVGPHQDPEIAVEAADLADAMLRRNQAVGGRVAFTGPRHYGRC